MSDPRAMESVEPGCPPGGEGDKRHARDRYRPKYHYAPVHGFMNDPNGLIYHEGEYHLFYQHNPFDTVWGHMSWGHAVSRDLLHWEHLPVALREEDGVMIFSGSAVHDTRNSSQLSTGDTGPLVAIYTGHQSTQPQREYQCLAHSLDRGRTWTKYPGNPVLDLSDEHFRDPKVFWHEPGQRWLMTVCRADRFMVGFYASDDLKTWTHLSDFGPQGAVKIDNWECPELMELPIDGDPQNTRWVLQIGVGDGAAVGGSGSQYFIGHFDGTRFCNENPPDTVLWTDHGADFYAVQAFNNIPANDGCHIWAGWMSNWRYAETTPSKGWQGCLSFPRELGLTTTAEGIRLTQQPVHEINTIQQKLGELKDLKVTPGIDPMRSMDIHGDALDITVEFRPGSADRFCLRVRVGDGEQTLVGYDTQSRRLFVDRRNAGRHEFHEGFAAIHHAPLDPMPNGLIRLRVLVDASSVELFGNQGEAVITDRIFPDRKSTGVGLHTEGGEADLIFLRIHELQDAMSTQ